MTTSDAWETAADTLKIVLGNDPDGLGAMMALIQECRSDTTFSMKPLVSHDWLRFEVHGYNGFVVVRWIQDNTFEVSVRDIARGQTFEARLVELTQVGSELREAASRARSLLRRASG